MIKKAKKTVTKRRDNKKVLERQAAAKTLWLKPEKLQAELKILIDRLLIELVEKIKRETGTDCQLDINAPNIRIDIRFADDAENPTAPDGVQIGRC